MQLIIIEGLIGAGKTTFAEKLGALIDAKVYYEPVRDNPYLSDYYKNPKRYALEMQFWLMSVRFQLHQEAIQYIWESGKSAIIDRSIYGDWIFAKQNWLDGNIDDRGYESYIKHRDVMFRYLMVPHLTLFLDADPTVCLERIYGRGRDCEKGIPQKYLEGLHVLHRELMIELKQRGTKLVHIDWNKFRSVESVILEYDIPLNKTNPLHFHNTKKTAEAIASSSNAAVVQ
ncbi:MAG: deoxynucleoside kinase [Oligoflexia bacterium]|nr:deoxynucleoside kinase [Oligoflexia bacterium]MBF0364296.1 deoxynucleoside kinase [Oligoflexia bacterium]